MKLLELPDEVLLNRLNFGFSDDFEEYVSGDRFTSLASDGGTSVAAGNLENGKAVVTTGATDNNEAAISTTTSPFKFGEDKPHVFEVLQQYAEAATDDANVFSGFISAAAANTMVDNGAGPATTFDGCGFFKVDGGTNWNIVVSNSTTQTKVELTAANSLDKTAKTAGGAAQQKLRIEFQPYSASKGEVRFFIDDVLVYKVAEWTFPTGVMFARTYIKAGGANSEVLNVDKIDAYKRR
jgi:hypothetical protein